MKLVQRWKMTALHNKALVWASFLMAFGTLFYAGAAAFQVHIMRQSAKDVGEQTQTLITQAEKNAAAARTFADTADKINEAIRRANGIAFQAIDIGNRPWMGVNSVLIVMQARSPVRLNVNFTNFGKSPAEHLLTHLGYNFKGCPATNFVYKGGPLHPGKEVMSQSTIMPGQATNSPDSIDEHLIPNEAMMQMLDSDPPKAHFYFFGEAVYSDWHGGHHHTHFCAIYRPHSAPAAIAPEYNDAN